MRRGGGVRDVGYSPGSTAHALLNSPKTRHKTRPLPAGRAPAAPN